MANSLNNTEIENTQKKQDNSNGIFSLSNNRIRIILLIFLVMIIFIIIKLISLQFIDAEENKKAAIDTRTISYKVEPKRGTIYDRNGNVLAYSKEAATIYANPSEISNDGEVSAKLAKVLGDSASNYSELISDKSKKFVYIKRKIDTELGDELEKEKITGVYVQDDQKRVYPYGKVAGQIVGACNIDGDGLCGLELYYDDILRGSTGKTVRQQGNAGMPIPGGTVQETSVVDGQDIMITIDVELQQHLENVIVEWNKKMGTESMNSVLEDPTTGEIYAAASTPLFDPTNINSAEAGSTDLKCVSSTYEPGSTFKTVSATALLENSAITPETEIFCPASIQADEYEVSDAHERAVRTYTFREIMNISSNVGISLATEKMSYDKLYDKIIKYNLTKKTGVDYPGDTTGYLPEYTKWSKINSYNISFGQGISLTPLQLTRFYGALACDGIEQIPHFLMKYLQADKEENYDTEDVIDNKSVIPVVDSLLRTVVTDGTGEFAQIDGYYVVGKTGTAEIADSNGRYLSGAYYDSFVGFIDKSSLPMLCYVGAEKAPDETSVTRVWKDIMTFTIERLMIASKE